jgi:hypothetical protein
MNIKLIVTLLPSEVPAGLATPMSFFLPEAIAKPCFFFVYVLDKQQRGCVQQIEKRDS